MLFVGNPMFLLVPGVSKQHILHPGKVIESDLKSFLAEFEQPIAPEPNTDTVAYADLRGKFHQQGAKVTEIRQPQPISIILFERVGEAVSAENRQVYRVCSVTAPISAQLDSERNRPVVDVSAVGFAATSKREYQVGATLPVTIHYDQFKLQASARVQGNKILPDGSIRYGFLVPNNNPEARKTLQQVSSTIQRAQLRRLAGAA